MLVEAAYEKLHQLFKDTSRCGLQTENEKTDLKMRLQNDGKYVKFSYE